ncbi:PREDICTED: uncharacterized protein LOC104759363, partial [Camelina sativa]
MQRLCRTRTRTRTRVSDNGRSNNSFYKVSLSLVFLLWLLSFLSTLYAKDAALTNSVGIVDLDDGQSDVKAVPFDASSILKPSSVHDISDLSRSDDTNPIKESEEKEKSVKEAEANSIVSGSGIEESKDSFISKQSEINKTDTTGNDAEGKDTDFSKQSEMNNTGTWNDTQGKDDNFVKQIQLNETST